MCVSVCVCVYLSTTQKYRTNISKRRQYHINSIHTPFTILFIVPLRIYFCRHHMKISIFVHVCVCVYTLCSRFIVFHSFRLMILLLMLLLLMLLTIQIWKFYYKHIYNFPYWQCIVLCSCASRAQTLENQIFFRLIFNHLNKHPTSVKILIHKHAHTPNITNPIFI